MKIEDLIRKSRGVILNDELALPNTFSSITTDTRTLQKGDIFVALKGKTDGHQYIEEAIKKGACMVFASQNVISDSVPIVKVSDTYDCLFDLASLYLETYPVFKIAITGSVGKTTTKELIAAILSKKYEVLKSEGNKNNRIGIPQTLFDLNSKTECLVVELGMNHLHEIDKLSLLVKPDISVITNIGSAHIGYLGSKKKILEAKMEITAGMEDGVLLLNQEDNLLQKVEKRNIKVNKVSKKDIIDIEILEQTIFSSKLKISNGVHSKIVIFKHPGEKIIENIALALHVGMLLEVPFELMMEAVEAYEPEDNRFHVKQLKSGHILVNDSYNSSYESVKMDLDLLEKMPQHKILFLGDILEVGKMGKKIHQKIGKDLRNLTNIDVYFVGENMKYAFLKYGSGKYFENNLKLISYWKKNNFILEPSIILLKGSRKMKLEELLPYLEDE